MKTVTELPFNRFVGIEIAADPASLLRLPADDRYLNHLGTVHASALLALAEASSGEFLLRHLHGVGEVIPVVRRMESKFRKPALGAVTSSAAASAERLSDLVSEITTRGRALITVDVELRDERETHVLSASVEWFIQRGAS